MTTPAPSASTAPTGSPTHSPTHSPALLLIAHGTRDPRGAQEMSTLVDQLRATVPLVEAAWLEDFAEPDAAVAAERLVRAGAQAVVTLPFLVLGAGHAKTDVPEAVWEVREAFGDVPVRHGRILGLHPALFALAHRRVEAVAGDRASVRSRPDELLLVTGAGSSDPDANGDLAKAARFLAEYTGHRWVDTAYAGVTWPTADVALRRAAAAGASRAVVFSWSLLAGLLEQRVVDMAAEVTAETGLEVVDAGRFGPDPLIVDAVIDRYREAVGGDARMNCDLCQYRMPVPGREQRAGSPSAGGTGERVL